MDAVAARSGDQAGQAYLHQHAGAEAADGAFRRSDHLGRVAAQRRLERIVALYTHVAGLAGLAAGGLYRLGVADGVFHAGRCDNTRLVQQLG